MNMNFIKRLQEKSLHVSDSAPIVIACLGDSVTNGCFEIYRSDETTICTRYSPTEAYHQNLKTMLETILPNVTINVINAGISGDTAVNGARRVHRDIINYHPDLCIVCYGLNDCNRRLEGISDYQHALNSIFTQLKQAEIETIFLTPNMMSTHVAFEEKDAFINNVISQITQNQLDGILDKYMDAARDLCLKNSIPVCDCYAKWKKLAENGIDTTNLLANHANHPIPQMHWMFASSLFEIIMGF